MDQDQNLAMREHPDGLPAGNDRGNAVLAVRGHDDQEIGGCRSTQHAMRLPGSGGPLPTIMSASIPLASPGLSSALSEPHFASLWRIASSSAWRFALVLG